MMEALDREFPGYGFAGHKGGDGNTASDFRYRSALVLADTRGGQMETLVEGLTRLKKKFVIATLSNGNVALLTNMAKYGGLPWDAILSADVDWELHVHRREDDGVVQRNEEER